MLAAGIRHPSTVQIKDVINNVFFTAVLQKIKDQLQVIIFRGDIYSLPLLLHLFQLDDFRKRMMIN